MRSARTQYCHKRSHERAPAAPSRRPLREQARTLDPGYLGPGISSRTPPPSSAASALKPSVLLAGGTRRLEHLHLGDLLNRDDRYIGVIWSRQIALRNTNVGQGLLHPDLIGMAHHMDGT